MTTPGTKSISSTITSSTCTDYYANFNWPFVDGNYYYFELELDAYGDPTIYIYEGPISSLSQEEVPSLSGTQFRAEKHESMTLVDTISLDIPEGAISGSRFESAE